MSKREKLEQKVILAFKNGNNEDFIEVLYNYIKCLFSEKIRFIKNLLNYETEIEIIHEILSLFLTKKFSSIKRRFREISQEDYEAFFSSLYLGIKHTIVDILSTNEDYKIKQRLRKEIVNSLQSSSIFTLQRERDFYFIQKLFNSPSANSKLVHKHSNFLGISNSDIERLLINVLKSNKIELNVAVTMCYDYLKKNGYIKLSKDSCNIPTNNSSNIFYDKLSDFEIAKKVLNELKEILSQKEMEIFYLYFVKELKLKYISKRLDISNQLIVYYKNKAIKAVQLIVSKYKGEIDRNVLKTLINIMEKNEQEYVKS